MNTKHVRIAFSVTLLVFLAVATVFMFFVLRSPNPDEPTATAAKSDGSAASSEPTGEQSMQGFGPSNASESASGAAAEVPEDKTLRLTVPKMERVDDAVVPTAHGGDEKALKNNAGIHLAGTGYPWEREANVYIAGHREGFPNTPSDLAFHDLDVLEPGDSVILSDSDGNTYSYRVFEKRVVAADDLSVLRTMPNENVVTLQSCTLPDYIERLVVRAEYSRRAVNG